MNNLPLLLAVDGGALAVYLVGLALSIGLAVAAAALQKKGKRDPNQPIPTQVLQGGFISRIIGRRRVAPTVLAVGGRRVVKKKSGSGKNKGPATYEHYEHAWHGLCVGPAYAIHKIWVDGVQITAMSAITRDDTPSGSFVPTGVGGFYVFWGEETQAPSTLVSYLTAQNDPSLGNGAESGWPFLCYVVWQGFPLGPQPIWPQVEYEIEVRPQGGAQSEDFIRAVAQTPYLFDDPDYEIPSGTETFFDEVEFEVVETGAWTGVNQAPGLYAPAGSGKNIVRIFYREPTLNAYTWSGDVTNVNIKLIGPSAQEIELYNEDALGTLYQSANNNVPAGWTVNETEGSGFPVSIYIDIDLTGDVDFDELGTWTLRAEITSNMVGNPDPTLAAPYLNIGAIVDLTSPTAGSPPAGTWIEDGDQIGANPADAFLELLTLPFPHGAGVDDGVLHDNSFDIWRTKNVTEVLPANIYAANGELCEDVLGTIMTDHGYFLSYNPNEDCGHFLAQPLRDPPAGFGETPIVISPQQNVGARPEVETPLLGQAFDRVMFTYQDKGRDYKETVIVVDEDGQASLLEVQRAIKSPIYTATDYVTARKLAEVKAQEDLPKNSGYKLELNRDANLLWPGLSITIDQVDPDQEDVLNVLEIEEEQLTPRTRITAVQNNYDAESTEFVGAEPAPGGAGSSAPVADLAAAILEVPTVLLQTRQTRVMITRVRANEQILGANVYMSSDGTTYLPNQDITDAAIGGTLVSGIAADDPWEIELGPMITIQGEDVDEAEDLTPDEPAWRAGRQVAVIGNEIFFVRKLQAVTSTTYQLTGLIRGRYATSRATHAIGAQVYVFIFDDATDLSDPKILPGQTLYAKPAPRTLTQELALGSVTARTKVIRGNGVVPDPVVGLRVSAPRPGVNTFHTGEDVTLAWGYINFGVPGTGAGLQGAGDATGVTPPYGTFEIQVYDTGDTLVATYDVGVNTTWTYDNADIITDLGSEETFYVEVRNVNGGFRSAAQTLQVDFS